MSAGKRFRFSIDRGGTFTDIYCEIVDEQGNLKSRVLKLLSEDPANYRDAPTEGIRRLLEEGTGELYPRQEKVKTHAIEWIRMGTTVATNALLERKGERIALVTTKGFGDLQKIGNQSRPKIFDLKIVRPELLYEEVVEVDERVVLVTDHNTHPYPADQIIVGKAQDKIFIEKSIQKEAVAAQLQRIYDKGIRSLAVVFIHSYTYSQHEQDVKEIASKIGFTQISCSHEVMPMIRAVPRGGTASVDAYLTPVIQRYLSSFRAGFDEHLSAVKVSFMQSDGGLTPMENFFGNRAILSGPAGGVVGYARTSEEVLKVAPPALSQANTQSSGSITTTSASTATSPLAVIGFDMGGTSTDVSRYAGRYEHVFESMTSGVLIQSPQLDINTVAAGGGSRLFFRNGLFKVGPESAGAHPGPLCYRKGGYLTVTDANVLLGRLPPHLFPAIFGPNEDLPLDVETVKNAFDSLTQEINEFFAKADANASTRKLYTPEEVALGFLRVANEAMARPIRNLTTNRGHALPRHVLGTFGGAGPQHCCALGMALGLPHAIVYKHSGILSAYGLSLSDIVVEKQEAAGSGVLSHNLDYVESRFRDLETQVRGELGRQGFSVEQVKVERYLNLRYEGTDTSLMTCMEDNEGDGGYALAFARNYRREYGFELQAREILIDDIRVRGIGQSSSTTSKTAANTSQSQPFVPIHPTPMSTTPVYFASGWVESPVFDAAVFTPGVTVFGPAIIKQETATLVLEEGCVGRVVETGDIWIDLPQKTASDDIAMKSNEAKEDELAVSAASPPNPIYLSVFAHRFMSIAEQMGRTLQRTSISVNIKERLDFSCAVFDEHGGLVANAPHLPVHLGSMSEAVKFQVRYWTAERGGLQEGDVLVSNHPQLAGGSHLPDITVITPVFWQGKIIFYVASRGHHADVGGIAPGSMPPLSTSLREEGAAIVAFKLVQGGVFMEDGIKNLLLNLDDGSDRSAHTRSKHLTIPGARRISDNLSDLRAQVAANHRGVQLMGGLVQEYGWGVVRAYMHHLQDCAEKSVREMLKSFSESLSLPEVGSVYAEDYLDDGSRIALTITIDRSVPERTSAKFDFSGSAPEMLGNLNAPPSVTTSAVIYTLRCLLPESEIPLNQGCLAPIQLCIPKNSLLSPSPQAAVVGGNVLTSQRITDVVLKAFRACAASQGCMNNLTFGDESGGYYETIAGGAGAGQGWDGVSGVHTHMTNTRITDVEIMERRYPVIVRRFGLRAGSGGRGQWSGGDGVIRELEFTKPQTVSILSERRAFQPYGMEGGEPGARGLNLLRMAEEKREVNLGGKNTVQVLRGDRLVIMTPGGGGWGKPAVEGGAEGSGMGWSKDVARLMTGSLFNYVASQESV